MATTTYLVGKLDPPKSSSSDGKESPKGLEEGVLVSRGIGSKKLCGGFN